VRKLFFTIMLLACVTSAHAGFAIFQTASNGVAACTTNGSDGFAGAPAVSPQHPTLLASYVAPPGWCVAGVGYGVGASGTLTDWQSIGSTIPGFTCNSGTGACTATCSSGAVTVNGIDFSLHGGAYIVDATNGCNLTVINSNFGNTPSAASYTIHIQTTNANLTVKTSTFTGGNSTYGAFIGFQAIGTVVMEYNDFFAGAQHVIEQVSGVITLTYKFNLIENMAQEPSSHDNWLQFGTIGSGSTADVEYNLGYTNMLAPSVGAGEGFQFYANNSGTLTSATLANNTMIATIYNSGATMSNIIHGGTVSSGTNNNNYFDCSGCSGTPLPHGAYYVGTMTGAQGWASSGNKNMNMGNTITPN
jgi:hypothetical protein